MTKYSNEYFYSFTINGNPNTVFGETVSMTFEGIISAQTIMEELKKSAVKMYQKEYPAHTNIITLDVNFRIVSLLHSQIIE